MAFKTKYMRWQRLFCFIRQKHFCRFLPLAEDELVQMVIWEVRNAWPAKITMTSVTAQFNGWVLSSFQCRQAFSGTCSCLQCVNCRVNLTLTSISNLSPCLLCIVAYLSCDHFNNFCLTRGKIATVFASWGKIDNTNYIG